MKNLIWKEKDSDGHEYIFLQDSFGKVLKVYWFVHDVILQTQGNNHFVFLKEENPEMFKIFADVAKSLKELKKCSREAKDWFFEGDRFVWHHMSRTWDKPFSDEDGFSATFDGNKLEIEFVLSAEKKRFGMKETADNARFFVSMGGPGGYIGPYQRVSDIFALKMNELVGCVPCKRAEEQEEKIH